ncbi:hypothetical protein Q7M_342 [Borrelia crocidurae str. Achema]|uniref:ABC transporter domain-containing protein n=1 Tax=Borrelia crocidurae (strain Achema) TaxID=1155096 RepID=I0FCB5_BORCA|nr:hypothetical protein Q7M_342 [Borrelia crocidurae str. Achema]
MTNEKDIILKVENLVQTFTIGENFLFWKNKRKVNAVNGISFEVERNKTLGLVGESGCGKSTTLRTIMQLYTPTSGRIYFNGKDITKLSKKRTFKDKKRHANGISRSTHIPKSKNDNKRNNSRTTCNIQ